MDTGLPITVICTYQVKPGREEEMRRLLSKQWIALRACGVVTEEQPRRLRALPGQSGPRRPDLDERTFVEIYSWRDARAPEIAHANPDVIAVWAAMESCCESMHFPNFAPFEVSP